jgi:aryl sulfotransferase
VSRPSEPEEKVRADALKVPSWPCAGHVVRNHTIDSRRWSEFRYRAGDVVIATWAKAGTSWMQQIVAQLVFGGAADVPTGELAHWIEQRASPAPAMFCQLEAQRHRRFVKTHLPPEALPYSPSARYIYVGRDGRDVLWSWYNHHCRLSPVVYAILKRIPDRVGPPLLPPCSDPRAYFHEWLDRDGYPLWPFWSHVQSWWNLQSLPNVLLVHFNDLKADLAGEIRRVAHFLEIDLDAAAWAQVHRHCSFDYMKEHAARLYPFSEHGFIGGARTYIHKGATGGWRESLGPDDVAKYEQRASSQLTEPCRLWLVHGRHGGVPDG